MFASEGWGCDGRQKAGAISDLEAFRFCTLPGSDSRCEPVGCRMLDM